MTPELLLLITAVGLGAAHTALGVDHTLPFIALGRARRWSLRKTLGVTFGCGLGHVLSSIAVGSLGVALGITTSRLEAFESLRGNWAAILLIGFGSLYTALSAWRLLRGQRHSHVHVHPDGTVHTHNHAHSVVDGKVMHRHEHRRRTLPLSNRRLIPALFIIFVLGPCEALVPLMFAPAASGFVLMPWLIALSFSLATLATMLALVALGYSAVHRSLALTRGFQRLEPHMNWAAGLAIVTSGLAIEFLGI